MLESEICLYRDVSFDWTVKGGGPFKNVALGREKLLLPIHIGCAERP